VRQLPDNVTAALRAGHKIDAIKLLREATGLGLKEAKELIDQHATGLPMQETPAAKPRTVGALLTLPFQVAAALRSGNKIEAIRLMREKAGLGLEQAKTAVDAFEQENRDNDSGRAPGEVPRSGGGFWWIVLLVGAAALAYYYFRHGGAA
jgi:ribosomal protein L7/L12